MADRRSASEFIADVDPVCFLQRKSSAVNEVKQKAQEVLGEGERFLDEANQLSENINKEIEVLHST